MSSLPPSDWEKYIKSVTRGKEMMQMLKSKVGSALFWQQLDPAKFLKDQNRGKESMGTLRSLVEKDWPEVDSKLSARLLCGDAIRIFEEAPDHCSKINQLLEALITNHRVVDPAAQPEKRVAVPGKKRKLDIDQGIIDASSLNLTKTKKRMTNWVFIKDENTVSSGKKKGKAHGDHKKKIDDGVKWKKYGGKRIKGSDHPREYYKCPVEGCPVTIQEQRYDDHFVEIMYFEDHNCKQQAHPDAPVGSSLLKDGTSSKQINVMGEENVKQTADDGLITGGKDYFQGDDNEMAFNFPQCDDEINSKQKGKEVIQQDVNNELITISWDQLMFIIQNPQAFLETVSINFESSYMNPTNINDPSSSAPAGGATIADPSTSNVGAQMGGGG